MRHANARAAIGVAGLAIAATAAHLVAPSDVALAVTVNENWRDASVSYCVDYENLPIGFTATTFAEEVDAVLDEWNSVPGVLVSALDLTQEPVWTYGQGYCKNNPSTYDYLVEAANLTGKAGNFNGVEVQVDDDTEFWAPVLNEARDGRYSLRGVLMHEVGHSFGLAHSGNQAWNVESAGSDTTQTPTMTESLNTTALSVDMHTPEADDEGGVLWVENKNPIDWWSTNASFETGIQHWLTTGGSEQADSSKSWRGTRSALMENLNEHFRMQQLYDPWKGSDASQTPSNGMDSTPEVTLRTHYWNDGTTSPPGGVRIKYNLKDFDYDTLRGKDEPDDVGTWSATSTLKTCNLSNKEWKACTGTLPVVSLYADLYWLSYSDNAMGIRVTFQNRSSRDLYIDTAGMEGW